MQVHVFGIVGGRPVVRKCDREPAEGKQAQQVQSFHHVPLSVSQFTSDDSHRLYVVEQSEGRLCLRLCPSFLCAPATSAVRRRQRGFFGSSCWKMDCRREFAPTRREHMTIMLANRRTGR